MSKSTKIKGPGPKIRRPVQKKPNTVMKSKKDYNRKELNLYDLMFEDYISEPLDSFERSNERASEPEFELGGDKEEPDPDIGW